MNKLFSIALIACFFTSVAFSNAWVDHEGFELSKLIIIPILACILWMTTPFTKLCLKSLAFIVFLDAVWNVGQFFMDGEHQGSLELLNGLIFAPWLAWAYFRSYSLKSSAMLPDRAYFISGKPKNIGSFYLSLFGDPTGSKGVYVNGKLYGYHRGTFISRTLDADKLNVIAIEIKSANKIEEYLRTRIGTEYSLINNCVSLRIKVWCHVRQTTL